MASRDFEVSIRGDVIGEIWWPYGAKAFKPVGWSPRFSEDRFTLRDCLDSLMASEGGDFSNAPKINGVLVLKRYGKGTRSTERIFDLSMFPSIADYVTDEIPDYPE